MIKKKANAPFGIKEIAKRAKVSIATVDRVIHNRSGVSPVTHEKISRIIKELDYHPNLMARRLASRKIIRLATLIPEVSPETSFWEAPLNGIKLAESEIRSYGITIDKFFFDLNSKASFEKQSKIILRSKPDGLLLAPSFIDESTVFVKKCKQLNIPYVFINSDIPDLDSLCYIGPHLYQSGYLAANLADYLVKDNDAVLIVNISKEIDNHHHLLRKEEGFRSYFSDHNKSINLIKADIKQIDYPSIKKGISNALSQTDNVKLIFVTNSRVSRVASYLKESGKEIFLIGYDFLRENIEFLDKGIINFLICQKPLDQAYKGIMTLYQHLALSVKVEEIHFMPIDIITRENYSFYEN